MASFCIHSLLIMVFLAFPSLSLSSQANPKASTISASPALPSSNPPPSTFQELSPDISPLLPSPGGVVPTPIVSSIPNIPSNLSPPNPDDLVAPGPFSAFSPFGSMPASSSATPTNLVVWSSMLISCFLSFSSIVWI